MTDDFQAIRNLAYTYAFRLDEGDFDGVAELLADGTLRLAAAGMSDEEIRGRDAIRRFYTEQVVTFEGKPRTRHEITNHAIEMDPGGGSATSRCYFTVLQAPPRLPFQIIIGGRYHDRFAKTDGVWHFTEKVINVDYLNDIAHHFRIAAEHREPGDG